ncbi:MAG: hypothetical protein QM724_11765 [Flavobacteriales bacterium]
MRRSLLAKSIGRAAVIAALPLCACGSGREHDGDRVVAEAYDEQLYWSDLRQLIPPGTPAEDSAAMARNYIDNWARERVVLHKAEENLSDAQKDVDRQLKAYRESLITYAYEQALVRQKLDTAVSDEEIEQYYRANEKNFELKDNIVRARWFKLRDADPRLLRKVEDLWRSSKEQDRHELELLIAQHGSVINDTHDDWIELKELQQQVPLHPDNPTDWLPRNSKAIVKDSVGTYFVDLVEQRLKDSISPIGLVRNSIRSIIINQRKLQLIERMRKDLYNDALAEKDVRIH